jgi:glycosyltransferase involved in cell wall biosynthesis
VSAINLTANRQPDGDGLFFPRSGAGVLGRLLRLRPDILHLHIGGHLPWRLLLLGLVCAAWPRARAILTFHSGGYPASEEGRGLTRRSLKARVLRRFDRVIAVNDDIRSFFLRCGVAADRVSVVSPYGGARPSADPLPQGLETFLAAHAPRLVTIGLLEPEYDLDLQIAILGSLRATHPRAGLVILGSGSLDRALRERLARTPWRDHVLLHGDLAHDQTLAVLARADVFVRTTRYDGDALSVREALTLGVPVVATRTALRPSGVQLVPVGDQQAIEDAIRAALAAPATAVAAASPDLEPGRTDSRHADNIAAVVRVYEDALGVANRSSIRETSPA